MIHKDATQRSTRYTAISCVDYMKIEVPPTSFVVEGLVVEGAAVLFSAREKSGKGLISLDMLVSIATGTTFLDRPVKEGPVIYLALEESIGTIKNRLHHRLQGNTDIPLYVMQLDGSMDEEGSFYIDSVEGIDGLAEQISIIQPAVVVIDTLREAHQGRENESDDMAPRLSGIRSLAHKTNTTIIVTHHAAKMTGGARGSTAIRAAFDDTLEFARDDSADDTQIRGAIYAEGRNLPKAVEHIAFNGDTFRWEVTSAPATVATPNLRQKVIDILNSSDEWLDAKEITEKIPSASLGSIQNQLGRMMAEKPRPFAVNNEKPTKGNPRRYHGIQSRDIPHNASQMTNVSDDESEIQTVGRKCVDCGAPTGDESRPYCSDHVDPSTKDLKPTGTEGFRFAGEAI